MQQIQNTKTITILIKLKIQEKSFKIDGYKFARFGGMRREREG